MFVLQGLQFQDLCLEGVASWGFDEVHTIQGQAWEWVFGLLRGAFYVLQVLADSTGISLTTGPISRNRVCQELEIAGGGILRGMLGGCLNPWTPGQNSLST